MLKNTKGKLKKAKNGIVYNYLQVAPPTTLLARTNDAYITTKIKAKLIASGLSPKTDTSNRKLKVLKQKLPLKASLIFNPNYKNVLLDIYDFFEKKLKQIRKKGIKHNNIILDPGIGFGKNLKHNITLINNISIFHSLGLPIMLGLSRKKFIKDISGLNDSKERVGGTVASCIYSMSQGVQILRVHDVNEINQGIKVFKKLNY